METTETIRPAAEADRDAIMALYRSMLGLPGCAWDEGYPNMEILTRDLGLGNVFVLTDAAGALCATISIDSDDDEDALPCWTGAPGEYRALARLCVRGDLQGRGLARRMLAFGMEELRRRGCRGVHFLVSPNNPRALASYAVFNFHNRGTVSLYGSDWYCYEKSFDE